QTKSYKTFGGKLASSEVEDKENGEFHHEVILTVQSHSASALTLRCSTTPQNTHKAGSAAAPDISTAHQSFNNKVTCTYHSEHIRLNSESNRTKTSCTLPRLSKKEIK
ncbi:hypothetical protein ATANTOWER_032151, partial [Ataeniobius toweri]|nr:hypothetical protein [Ataeniobius toweri]